LFKEGVVTYDEWEQQVPREIKADSVWRIKAFRLGLFLSDLARLDAKPLWRRRETTEIADQLTRAAWRISSCVEEGYSRDTRKARSLFYEYALGSAREARGWYYKGREALPPKVVEHRLSVCAELIKLQWSPPSAAEPAESATSAFVSLCAIH
jgi:four helix bundle protein